MVLCGFVVCTKGCFVLNLALLFVLMFFSPVWHCNNLAWGRESWFLCLSCICMVILHAFITIHFLFLLVPGIGCGLLLRNCLDFSINFLLIFYILPLRRLSDRVEMKYISNITGYKSLTFRHFVCPFICHYLHLSATSLDEPNLDQRGSYTYARQLFVWRYA